MHTIKELKNYEKRVKIDDIIATIFKIRSSLV